MESTRHSARFGRPSGLAVRHRTHSAFGSSRRIDREPLTVLRELNAGLHRALRYERGSTRADSPIDECLASGKGVCQDFAHVFIAAARELGIPARYVSGYLFRRRGDDEGPASDATHAWAEAFLPDVGWLGFDPSNDVAAGPAHVRVAVGRDYRDVPPTRGVFKGISETKLTVHVDVTEDAFDLRIGVVRGNQA
jgi:transglutaminase-like putative cysteine protease